MKITKDGKSYGLWLGGEKLEGFKFRHNDCVVIVSGENKGKKGVVVALQCLEERSSYIIETELHGDIEAKENELEHINL